MTTPRTADMNGSNLKLTQIAKAKLTGRRVQVAKFFGAAGGERARLRSGDIPPITGPGVVQPSRQIPKSETTWSDLTKSGHVLAPPYDPWQLVVTVEESDTLPAMVDAMAVNVAGHGYALEPRFPTEDPDTKAPVEPPSGAKAQRDQARLFVERLAPGKGIDGLIDLLQRDLEQIGWAVCEVLRDRSGNVAMLEHMRAFRCRKGQQSLPILVSVPSRTQRPRASRFSIS